MGTTEGEDVPQRSCTPRTPADQRRRQTTGMRKSGPRRMERKVGGTHGQCGRRPGRCRWDRMRGGARVRPPWTERVARCTGREGNLCAHGGRQNGRDRRHLGRGPTIWGGANAARQGAPRDRAGPTRSGPRDSRDTSLTTCAQKVAPPPACGASGGALHLGSPAARGGERSQTVSGARERRVGEGRRLERDEVRSAVGPKRAASHDDHTFGESAGALGTLRATPLPCYL